MSDGPYPREVVFDSLRSGLTTDSMLEDDPPALRVSWIAWDSGFRGSGLQVGDQIIAVNGETIPRPTELRELQRLTRELPGDLNDGAVFAARGLKDGSPLTVTIRRRRQMEALLQSIEDLKPMLEPSTVESDFSRAPLEQMLR